MRQICYVSPTDSVNYIILSRKRNFLVHCHKRNISVDETYKWAEQNKIDKLCCWNKFSSDRNLLRIFFFRLCWKINKGFRSRNCFLFRKRTRLDHGIYLFAERNYLKRTSCYNTGKTLTEILMVRNRTIYNSILSWNRIFSVISIQRKISVFWTHLRQKKHNINKSVSKTEFVMDEFRHRNGTCTRVNNLFMQQNYIVHNFVIKAVIIRLLCATDFSVTQT